MVYYYLQNFIFCHFCQFHTSLKLNYAHIYITFMNIKMIDSTNSDHSKETQC